MEKRRPSYTKHNELKAKRNFFKLLYFKCFFELDIQNSQFFYRRVKIKNQTQCDFCYKYKI